ncbi:hypothetical protein BHM03_00047204 [Ensete ventricosum]|uniref:Reverse transcriptase RNase H-like domain-containing protein n=1 Tax=Ensete ventricosum TaxID=4639 RepID=A0A445MLJ9_ENSVE|nr:hypothetical protein BHM03_00047204 [Ensete ventricosum]
MARYLTKARRLIGMTKYFKISQIPCLENSMADALARLASVDIIGVLSAIPSLRQPMVVAIETTTMVTRPDWREEILHYKKDVTLPLDKATAHRVKRTEAWESPYSLAFGTKAVLLPEVVFLTLRIKNFTPEVLETGLRENLDLLEERRTEAHLKTLHYQRAVARLYNRRIRPRPISTGDLVLRKAEVSDSGHSRGILAPRWEDLYHVTQVVRDGTYTLVTMEGKTLPRT